MADKVDQHLLPKVYLLPFVSRERPPEHPADVPYDAPIWLIPKALDGGGRAKAPKNAFTANRFYNLRDDDPREPAIELILSRIESAYARVRRLLEQNGELSVGQYGTLLIFIGSLRARQPAQIDHWQKQYGEVERIHRSVERAHTGSEQQSDKVFWMKDEMALRMMFTQAEAYADVVARSGWFLVNQTEVPFLTSDHPVIHRFLHPDEIETLAFPKQMIAEGATRADWAFFCYCPLTPSIAFVSSPLLHLAESSLYVTTKDARLVLMLNDLQRQNCDHFLISPLAEPFGSLTPMIQEIDELGRKLMESAARNALTIHTSADRYQIPCSRLSFEEGRDPLHSVVRFRTSDLAPLAALTPGTAIRELLAYTEQGDSQMIQGARIVTVGRSADEDWVIEADPLLPGHRRLI